MTAPNPNSPAFDVLAYAEARSKDPIGFLLSVAMISAEGETWELLRVVRNAIRENRYVHADRDGAALAAYELDIAAREYVGLLEDVAAGGRKMTDAPERIWLDWRPGLAVTSGPLASKPRTEYIRSDTVAAMVAEARNAALEEAAAFCENIEMGLGPKSRGKYIPHPSICFEVGSGTHAGMGYAAAIRALKDAPNA